jgi:two-component system sensor histidine kinase EvgS
MAMLFYRGLKPALGWLFLLAVLGWMQSGVAAQMALDQANASGNVPAVELDAHERQWIRDNPRVTVASVQYPLYLFRTNTASGAV